MRRGRSRAADADAPGGLTLPGLANAHSHAFQRALRGRTHAGTGLVLDLARADVRAGRDARPRLATSRSRARRLPRWRSPASPSSASSTTCTTRRHPTPRDGRGRDRRPRAEAGIRLTLLDACYLRGGLDELPRRAQLRFATATPRVGERVDALTRADGAHRRRDPQRARRRLRVGARRRRVGDRARRAAARARVGAAGRERGVPGTRTARTPTDALAEAGALSPSVHRGPRDAPQRHRLDAARLAGARVPLPHHRARPRRRHRAGPAAARGRRAAVRRLGLAGGDRPLRGGARDRARRAPGHRRARQPHRRRSCSRRQPPAATTASAGPAAAASRRAPRRTSSPSRSTASRLAGTRRARASRRPSSPAAAADVRHVMVGGRWIVRDGAHVSIDVARDSRERDRGRSPESRRRQHRAAGHERPGARRGARTRDAALVIEDGVVVAVERAGARPTSASTPPAAASSRASSTATRTSCSPATAPTSSPRGWRARRTRRAASASRPTRRARRPTTSCAALTRARRDEALRAGITHLEIKSGYGLDVDTERRLCEVAARVHRRRHVPRRPRRARRSTRAAPTTTSSSSAATCSPPARRTRAGSTCSARRGAFDADQSPRGPRTRARSRASACASTATSSATGRACSSPSSWAPRRSTTARTSATTTSPRSPGATRSPRSCRPPTSPPASRIPTRAARSTPARRSRSPRTATRARATRPRWRSASRSPCATCA